MTPEQARRLLWPPRSDLVYERAFVRLFAHPPRRLTPAQRRELAARRLPDGSYPVPLRIDPTLLASRR